VSPILGIYASQISGHLFAPSGAYDSIATTTVGAGGSSTITFSSIPSTYQHLQLRYIARDTLGAADVTGLLLRFNSDSGTNYTRHYLLADGSAVYAGAGTSRTSINGGLVLSGGGPASVFAAGVIDVLDYANTNKYKTYRVLDGVDTNGTSPPGYVDFESALWLSTSAVTSITITLPSGNYAQYSQFALYGIRGGN
jgi:hypothetical protein